MKTHAIVFFHKEWNAWTVGFYRMDRAGRAESYTTCPTRDEAARVAGEHNGYCPVCGGLNEGNTCCPGGGSC